MMTSTKLTSGGEIPPINVQLYGGGDCVLGQRSKGWQVIIIYRGLHCPLCKKYLQRLEELKEGFAAVDTDLLAVSGDSLEKAASIVRELNLTLPIGYDLSIDEMQQLGLYISEPRSEQETDRPFAEPATFVINPERKIQLIGLSNTPFNRADLSELLETIEWVQENDYPIRGTYQP